MPAPAYVAGSETSAILAAATSGAGTKPAGVVNGHLLIAHVTVRTATTITAPSGTTGGTAWQSIPFAATTFGTGIANDMFYKVVQDAANEPASWTWTYGASAASTIVIYIVSGASATPLDGHTSIGGDAAKDVIAPSFSTTAADRLIIAGRGNQGAHDSTLAAPNATFTAHYWFTAGGGVSRATKGFTGPLAVAGATGDLTFTFTGSFGVNANQGFGIGPAAPTDTTPPAAPTGLTATVIAPPA